MRHAGRVAVAGLVAVLGLGCSGGTGVSGGDGVPDGSEGDPAGEGPDRGPRTVVVGDAPPVRAEVADSAAERGHGLMDRDRVPPGTGMLFVFDGPTQSDFYMFRTRVPLSIAFVDGTRVVGTREMPPCTADAPEDCPTYGVDAPYTLAVEAPAGHFSTAGVRTGDRVTVQPPLPGTPRRSG
ncbi:MAG: DUF192 domain-containing protein [Actinomycetes bacterium]